MKQFPPKAHSRAHRSPLARSLRARDGLALSHQNAARRSPWRVIHRRAWGCRKPRQFVIAIKARNRRTLPSPPQWPP